MKKASPSLARSSSKPCGTGAVKCRPALRSRMRAQGAAVHGSIRMTAQRFSILGTEFHVATDHGH